MIMSRENPLGIFPYIYIYGFSSIFIICENPLPFFLHSMIRSVKIHINVIVSVKIHMIISVKIIV